MAGNSIICDDSAIGPAVSSPACRGGFDFTVKFEESILSILPSAVFILAAAVQCTRLVRKRSPKVRPSLLLAAKLATITSYSAIQLAILVQQSLTASETTPISIASAVLGLLAALSMAALSTVEHRNTFRPSFILSIYLILSVLFDIARVRTSWLRTAHALAGTSTASVVLKVAILVLETVNKRKILLDTYSKLSSEATSSLPSRGLFLWLASLLGQGSKKILTLKDLFAIHEKLDPHRLTMQLSDQWNKSDHTRRHGLALATLWAWRAEFAKIALPRLILIALSISQPFIVEAVIENTLAKDSPEIQSQGYGLIGAVAFAYFGQAILTGFYQHLAFRLMAMTRGALIGMIYRKLTRSRTGAAETADSAVLTLIEADVERIGESWYLLIAELWPSVIQLGLAVWLLQRQLGAICIAPVVLAILFTLTSAKAAGFMMSRQKLWLQSMQRRINFTTNVLSNIKAVKMLGLSDKMQHLIRTFRATEIDRSKKFRSLSSFNITLMNMPDSFGQLVTFAAFAIVARIQQSDEFTVTKAISSLSILAILMEPLGQLLYCIPQILGALGCFERIQEFLTTESWSDNRLQPVRAASATSNTTDAGNSAVEMQVLPTHRRSESIVVENATFGWNSTVPMLHNITLRLSSHENVTMVLGPVGCGKSTLLKSLLGETVLQSGTVALSTQEVSYCDQSPWLSAGTVRSIIVGTSEFCERLYKSVVYACALDVDFELLENGDQTQIRGQGNTLSGGQKQRVSIARALFSRKPIAVFDDVLSGLDPVTRDIVLTRVFGPKGLVRELGIIAVLATHATDRLEVVDKVVVMDGQGRIVKQGPPDLVSVVPSTSGETQTTLAETKNNEPQPEEENAGKERQVGDVSVYKFYFRSLGWVRFTIFASIVCCGAGWATMQYAWISLWSNSSDSDNTAYWLTVYAMWAVLKALFLYAAVYFIYVMTVPRSALYLHGSVLETAFKAPMSFLAPMPTGVLVNRFSQDMRLVDMVLPGNLVSVCFILSGCVGAGALAVVASPYLAAVFPFLGALLYLLQRFYLKTSRQLRLLELEAKAPLLSHVIDTIRGMMSIRAYGWEGEYAEKLETLLADCQKPFYLLLCIQRWLGVVLGITVGLIAVLLTSLAVTLRGNNTSAGFVGIALVNMMSLSQSLAQLIVQWTNLETSLGAVSRIKTFTEDTPREAEPESTVAADWPSRGAVSFDNWTAGYADATVLHGITMDLQPGQNVALCGRTGSGKSSLVTSILGMVDGTAGRIVIDGVDLSTVSGETVRKAVTCVTQDPFVFGGSVRANLDPLETKMDGEIETALKRVGLWSVVTKAAESSDVLAEKALDMAADDVHLSHGQSQLFCLARAMLRDSKVVLLDEPTSSVDVETEKQIMDIVDAEFGEATVIMVTHRLSGIRRFDRVAVLNAGVLVEFGSPEELLHDGESALSKLCEAQGHGSEAGGSSG